MAWWHFWKKEERKYSERTGDWIVESNYSSSGYSVTADTALRIADVYKCIRVLAETIGTLPFITYRTLSNGGKERARDFYLYEILHDQPNEYQTAPEFWEMMIGHAALRGNAYARILEDARGRITELVPIHPDFISPIRLKNGKVAYQFITPDGKVSVIRKEEILHIRALSSDGLKGLSPIEQARETLGNVLARDAYEGALFRNGTTLSGALNHPGVLTDSGRENLRNSWNAIHQGSANAHKIAILEEGMKFQQIGMTNEDAQFLENKKFSRSDVAGIFRVPPHMIGDLERATFSNIEHQSIDFVVHCIRPWLVKIEKAIRRDLLTPTERQSYFCEVLVDGLLRGDTKSRYDGYAIARNAGWLSVDEIREMENRNPLPDGKGKDYLVPLNMGIAGEPRPDQQNQKDQSKDPSNDTSRLINLTINNAQEPKKKKLHIQRQENGSLIATTEEEEAEAA